MYIVLGFQTRKLIEDTRGTHFPRLKLRYQDVQLY
jgi:hypothetical protein